MGSASGGGSTGAGVFMAIAEVRWGGGRWGEAWAGMVRVGRVGGVGSRWG